MNWGNMAIQNKENSVPMLDEVPSVMKDLVRLVIDMFYTNEDKHIMNLLIHHGCIKEEDIGQLLYFDNKLLRSRLSILKSDRLVKEGYLLEERKDDRPQKIFHIYIHYNCFVNVVKYRLDQIAKELQIFERKTGLRCNFSCTGCAKFFEDLELDRIFCVETGKLTCTFCGSDVVEAEDPDRGSRIMYATFNDQMKVILNLLESCKFIRLSRMVLEPRPLSIEQIRNKDKQPEIEHIWFGEATRLKGLPSQNSTPRIQVTFNNDIDKTNDKAYHCRELPHWLRESTVISGDRLEPLEPVNDRDATPATISKNSDHENDMQEMINKVKHDDIVEMLMNHE